MILDRGWGKAAQSVEIAADYRDIVELSTDELIRITASDCRPVSELSTAELERQIAVVLSWKELERRAAVELAKGENMVAEGGGGVAPLRPEVELSLAEVERLSRGELAGVVHSGDVMEGPKG